MNEGKVVLNEKTVTHVVDIETGEVESTNIKNVSYRLKKRSRYSPIYEDGYYLLYKCTGREIAVFLSILKQYDYKNQLVTLDIGRKEIICKDVNMTLNFVNCIITKLIKKNLIVSKWRGTYDVNDVLLWKNKKNE